MKKTFMKAIALTAALTFCAATAGFTAGGSIGYGDISVYKNDKLVAKLSGQNPVEDGSLLICDGKCMVKSEGISLIGYDKSKLAVASEDDTFKIYLKEGRLDYVINSNVRKITFFTPGGSYTVAEAVFNAAGGSAVKGSFIVDEDGKTEITVTEGRLVFSTADGVKAVDANSKIVLAQTMGGAGGNLLVAGTLASGFVIAAVAIDSQSSSTPSTVTPVVRSTPTDASLPR